MFKSLKQTKKLIAFTEKQLRNADWGITKKTQTVLHCCKINGYKLSAIFIDLLAYTQRIRLCVELDDTKLLDTFSATKADIRTFKKLVREITH